MKRTKTTMDMPLFKKIVNEAQSLGCKDIHLTQYNEPMTDSLIFERLAYIRKMGMTSSFYSNATLLDKTKRDKLLKDPVDVIRFSVDGINKETFESIRRGANYENVTNNIISLFKERNEKNLSLPKIEVYFTILENNQKEMDQFKEFWKDKCDYISFYPADSRESKDYVQVNYSRLKPYPCFNPKRILVLSSGKVILCCVDIDGIIELGDLNKQTLKEVLLSKKFQEVYLSQINRRCNIDMCKNCSKFYIDSAFSWWNT
jgi:MoaA/NifB/PqqE/SkfB family radical SAM enzyme